MGRNDKVDEKRVRAWIDEQVRLRKELCKVKSVAGGGIRTCNRDDEVQIVRGARKVAETLAIPYDQLLRNGSHGKYNRISFTYQGIEFFELEDCDG